MYDPCYLWLVGILYPLSLAGLQTNLPHITIEDWKQKEIEECKLSENVFVWLYCSRPIGVNLFFLSHFKYSWYFFWLKIKYEESVSTIYMFDVCMCDLGMECL